MNNYNQIKAYNVTLTRLTEDKIEIVRQMRNTPYISQYMDYQEYITPEMQFKWFKRINNIYNYYYIINYDNKDIGLINIKDIDYVKKEGESGIFIWDKNYYGKQISYKARLALLDFIFEEIGLETIKSHVLSDNIRSQKSILNMGYKLDKGQDSIRLQSYTLSKNDYYLTKPTVISKLRE